ncbi:hypothetical protein [Stenotrophomonas sp.]|uniref:hypothetical protein n=1 Tax=Stenotrophomonas sp. TaxID=69392 RepID=UPI0028968AC0|nr:hypothetical protein [Stenotrophomonas sp.]
MASLSLGAFKDLTPSASPMPDQGVITITVGCSRIHVDAAEADQLARELMRAAQALRIGGTTAKQYTDALSGRGAA